jgi:hypothetical protein
MQDGNDHSPRTAAEYYELAHRALAQADGTRDPEAARALRQIGYDYIVRARNLDRRPAEAPST